MLDIQTLRNDLSTVAARLATRGFTLDTAKFEQMEAERKTIQTRTQELQAKRNATSKLIGQAKAKGEDTTQIMAEVGTLGDELKQLEKIRKGQLVYRSTHSADIAEIKQIASEADHHKYCAVTTD